MVNGKVIYKYRTRLNLTQQELADKVGTTPQNIYKYENDIIKDIPLKRIEKMAEIFGVSPSVLAGWEIDPDEVPSEPDALWDEIMDEVHLCPREYRHKFAESFLWHLRNNSIPAYSLEELNFLKDFHRLTRDGKDFILQVMARTVQTDSEKNHALSGLEDAR